MRTRIVSSVFIVLAGLLATLAGGPVFFLVLIGLGVAGYREYLDLATHAISSGAPSSAKIGYGVVVVLGLAAWIGAGAIPLFAITALAIAAPLVLSLPRSMDAQALAAWALASTGSLYLGLPVFAAIALRAHPGTVDNVAIVDLASRMSLGWDIAPRGLAWMLTVILATWIGDSTAYLLGRAIGRRRLAPVLSPSKTIEGAVGGLIGAMIVGALAFPGLGLGSWWLGLLVGSGIGIAGQLGDLGESFLKRQAGVKDSGALIPGHGGILDRIDALLFAFPVSLLLAAAIDRLGI